MIRGLYIAGSGLLNSSQNINVAGNNITNCNTPGFKKDGVVSGSFGEYLTYKMSNGASEELGSFSNGVTQDEIYTMFNQGALTKTGRKLDIALDGTGFFTLLMQDGSINLTRNGHFFLNENGFLTDAAGNLVLGQDGAINVGQADFSVSEKGEIISEGNNCGILLIASPSDNSFLLKEEGTRFSDNYPLQAKDGFQGVVKQGYLENSNVDMTEEMADIMQFSRSYQSCSQIIKMLDKISEKTVTELAKI